MKTQLKKYILFFIILLLGNVNCMDAQKIDPKAKPIKPIIYKKPITRKSKNANDKLLELSAGIKLHLQGWGIQIQRFKKNEEAENNQYNGFYLNIENLKDARELKISSKLTNPGADKSAINPKYVYGKINSFYPIKLGYNIRRSFTGKQEKTHIQLHYTAGAGLIVGVAKPYNLQISRNINGRFVGVDEPYSESNADLFLNPQYIYGYSGFSTGWSDLQIYPGINAHSGVVFEYSPNAKNPLFVEIGIQSDAYLQKIPILVGDRNKAIFPYGYVIVRKGVRW